MEMTASANEDITRLTTCTKACSWMRHEFAFEMPVMTDRHLDSKLDSMIDWRASPPAFRYEKMAWLSRLIPDPPTSY
jgi:hypothetical protein